MRDLYSVLNLPRRASTNDIKAAYWALAKQFHPDVNAGDKEAEGWTKEINRAYEILGDSHERAAYDLELVRQRAKARRSFLRGTTAGMAAALVLMLGCISIAPVWKQHALQMRGVKNEMAVARAPAQERATLEPAGSERRNSSADPGEPVSAPPARPPNELPASTSSETTSVSSIDWAAQTLDAPTSSPVAMEKAPEGRQPSVAPSEPARTETSQAQQPVSQASEPQAPPPTELANLASPEGEVEQPASATKVAQEPSSAPPRHNRNRKAEIVDKKPNKRSNVPRAAATTAPNRLQGSEREPHLVSSRPTALRWPTADEPFVNLGARNR
jgi:curved DNA-binding protein CbpA